MNTSNPCRKTVYGQTTNNSSGAPALISATGVPAASVNNLQLQRRRACRRARGASSSRARSRPTPACPRATACAARAPRRPLPADRRRPSRPTAAGVATLTVNLNAAPFTGVGAGALPLRAVPLRGSVGRPVGHQLLQRRRAEVLRMTRGSGRRHRRSLLAAGAASAQELQPRIGDPLPGLTAVERALFDAGKVEFTRILTVADGLGPIFNDSSCSTCHSSPRAGGAGSEARHAFRRRRRRPDAVRPAGVARRFAPAGERDAADLRRDRPAAGGRRDPARDAVDRGCRPGRGHQRRRHPRPRVRAAAGRERPRAHGAQLREAPRGEARRRPLRLEGAARERPQLLGGRLAERAGAQQPVHPDRQRAQRQRRAARACATRVPIPRTTPDGQGLHAIDRQTNFQRLLAPPPQTPALRHDAAPPSSTPSACNSCHVSSTYVTGPAHAGPRRSRARRIRPYSDFLLHDMGALGDGIVQGMATENEFRTTPLWGLRPRAEIGLLHDARATGGTIVQNVRDAITAHAGEAAGLARRLPRRWRPRSRTSWSRSCCRSAAWSSTRKPTTTWTTSTGSSSRATATSPARAPSSTRTTRPRSPTSTRTATSTSSTSPGFQRAMTGDQAAFNKLGPPVNAGSDRLTSTVSARVRALTASASSRRAFRSRPSDSRRCRRPAAPRDGTAPPAPPGSSRRRAPPPAPRSAARSRARPRRTSASPRAGSRAAPARRATGTRSPARRRAGRGAARGRPGARRSAAPTPPSAASSRALLGRGILLVQHALERAVVGAQAHQRDPALGGRHQQPAERRVGDRVARCARPAARAGRRRASCRAGPRRARRGGSSIRIRLRTWRRSRRLPSSPARRKTPRRRASAYARGLMPMRCLNVRCRWCGAAPASRASRASVSGSSRCSAM